MSKNKGDDAPKRGGGRKRKNDNDDKPEPKNKKTPPPPKDDPVHIFFPLTNPDIFSQIFNGDGNGKDDVPAKYKALKEKLLKLNLDDKIKERVLARLKNVDSDKHKHLEWFEVLLKIPFKKYAEIPVTKTDHPDRISKYFDDVYDALNKATYGMQQVKEEIVNYVAQIVSTENKNMPRIIALHGEAGVGKCLAKGTKILMFDGTLKNVEDIQVGDVIMGDDSTPRNILTLGTGKDQMYKIEDVKGESYTVNSEHILTLKYTNSKIIQDDKKEGRYRVKWFDNKKVAIISKNFSYKKTSKEEAYKEAKDFLDTIVEEKVCDIPIKKYLNLSKNLKEDLKGLYTGIEFKEKELEFDPYILGIWLGDGHHDCTYITNQDSAVINYLTKTLNKYNCYLQYTDNYSYGINSCDNSKKKGSNYMKNILRKHNLLYNKHIPHIYKCNSRENRLKLLAGLIDSDGCLTNNKTGFEITQSIEHEKLLDDIQYLCRSLGFACRKSKKKTSWTYKGVKNTGLAWRLNISGDGLHEVPTLIPRKRANERLQIKNALVSGITVTPVGYDYYYGFEIDGNKRFVLGNFIVTHNTQLLRRGLSECLKRPMKNFSCGGIRDSAFLNGFSFTYSGSRPGAIINGLIECGVSNPIFFFDELDKISTTNDGIDIQNVLIHLTDPVQNNNFEDKYFDGIPIDLSKVIFIFAFNDIGLISPILKDRLHIIKIPTPSIQEKVIIGTKYLTKELYPNIGFNEGDITFSEEIMKYIINQHCEHDKGVRNLKRYIETILLKINTARFIGTKQKYKSLKNKLTLPIEINRDMVDELVDKNNNEKDEFFRTLFI
jgi:hypothetical protein